MRLRTLLLVIFACMSTQSLRAQVVEEPPIPVTIVCPYHEDSLRRAYEAGLATPGGDPRQHLDSISMSTIRAAEQMSAQMERSFTYLYLLLGLLALVSIAALRAAYRLRIELQDLRNEQRMPPLALPAPVVVKTAKVRRTGTRGSSSARVPRSGASARKGTRPRTSRG